MPERVTIPRQGASGADLEAQPSPAPVAARGQEASARGEGWDERASLGGVVVASLHTLQPHTDSTHDFGIQAAVMPLRSLAHGIQHALRKTDGQ